MFFINIENEPRKPDNRRTPVIATSKFDHRTFKYTTKEQPRPYPRPNLQQDLLTTRPELSPMDINTHGCQLAVQTIETMTVFPWSGICLITIRFLTMHTIRMLLTWSVSASRSYEGSLPTFYLILTFFPGFRKFSPRRRYHQLEQLIYWRAVQNRV